MSFILRACIYAAAIAMLPPLIIGFIRTVKARMQGRQGSSCFQMYWDLAKFFHKSETVSASGTWVFRAAPVVGCSVTIAAALITPWLGMPSPISGDLILFVYLLAMGKFAGGLAALDTGSPFGAMAASREAAVSVQSEPAILLGLAALALHARTGVLSRLLAPGLVGPPVAATAVFVGAALAIGALAELSRMPIDDPATHLELTMIHEALVLENSGPGLALVEYAAALKTTLLLGLLAQVPLLCLPRLNGPAAFALSLCLIALESVLIAAIETGLVKLRWRRVPNFASYAVASGLFACLIVAIRG